mgnify:CR=1 FL=1
MNEITIRPWGSYEVIKSSGSYKIKRIIVEPGHRLSLQSHKKRDEFWVIVNGNAIIEIESSTYNLKYGESIKIKRNEADVEILDEESGISPGQGCVFYSNDDVGDKVLGGGWILRTENKNLST